MLAAYQRHMNALLQHQDPTGAWHQVIDRPESYRELTATSMIGFALVRGLRLGWISGERYRQAAERAWYAVKTRVRPDGGLMDVCTGTGKQPDLRAYYDRAAILGRDDRGGAMAMLFATEFAQLKR
jgi:rhamnogalacturonyl hydrolase YesR